MYPDDDDVGLNVLRCRADILGTIFFLSRPLSRVLLPKRLKGHFPPLLLTVGEPAICDDQRRGESADHQRHGSLDQRSGPCAIRLLHRLLPCPHFWWHPLAGMISLLTRARLHVLKKRRQAN